MSDEEQIPDYIDPIDELSGLTDFKIKEEAQKHTPPRKLADAPPERPKSNTEIVPVSDIDNMLYDKDFLTSRENILNILSVGDDVLASSLRLAEASDNPRVFESIEQTMRTLVELNESLHELHEKRKKFRDETIETKKEGGQSGGTKIENAVFCGSPAELLEALNNKNKSQ